MLKRDCLPQPEFNYSKQVLTLQGDINVLQVIQPPQPYSGVGFPWWRLQNLPELCIAMWPVAWPSDQDITVCGWKANLRV